MNFSDIIFECWKELIKKHKIKITNQFFIKNNFKLKFLPKQILHLFHLHHSNFIDFPSFPTIFLLMNLFPKNIHNLIRAGG